MDALLDLMIGGTVLDAGGFALLAGVSFLGSFIAGALGLGGGGLVLATMAMVLPPVVLIPIHGVVQLGSNLGRAILLARQVLVGVLPAFFIGTLIGAGVGGQLVITLPTPLLKALLAVFILYTVWAPKFRATKPGKATFFGVGVAGAFVTMFVGATGPLVAPFAAAASDERQRVVATHAALMVIQHGLKIAAFGLLGFAFGPYVPLLAVLLGCGFAGTWCGRLVLDRLPERVFRVGLKTIITVLSLKLLYDAARATFG